MLSCHQAPHRFGRVTGLGDMSLAQLGVSFGHPNIRMTQDLSQLVQISAVHHVPRGERMPEIVKTEFPDTGEVQQGFETLLHPLAISFRAELWQEETFLPDHSRVLPEFT